jgi:hypothetical protein
MDGDLFGFLALHPPGVPPSTPDLAPPPTGSEDGVCQQR